MSKTKYGSFRGELFYAQIFEQNRDMGGDQNDAAQAVAAKGGQYSVIFIPKDDAELQKMKDIGYPESSMGYPQIKTYDYADGRTGMKLKRPHTHPSIPDLGGAPDILDWTDGQSDKVWDMDVDGEVGNGSRAVVRISVYKRKEGATPIVRLESVAIVEHEVFEREASSDTVDIDLDW
jgi:hypothetical protein